MLWSPQCGGGIGESDWLVKQGGAEAAHLNQQTDNDSGAGDNDSGGGDSYMMTNGASRRSLLW